MASKRFRVAFTFAGEKRQFVFEVASILAARLGEGSILYDKFHEAEFGRDHLHLYLPELYHKEADLIVVIISADYERREWCGLEWAATFDLIKQRKNDSVMLCRFNHSQVRGLYGAGFVDLDNKSPHETSLLILQRLALNEGRHKDYYLQEADRLIPPSYRPTIQTYTFFDPCRFDLEDFTGKTMEIILDRNGLIGFGLTCHSLPLLKQCCERLKLEIGRSNIQVRDPFVIDPKFKTVEMGVRDVLRLRKLLEQTHVLLAVQVSEPANANLFWTTLKMSFPEEMNHKLVVVMALSEGCVFPEGLVHLETPHFQQQHAHRWVREIVTLMKWPENFIQFWVESLIAECRVESTELDPDQVYVHLNQTIKFIQETPVLADFEEELKTRKSIYVAT